LKYFVPLWIFEQLALALKIFKPGGRPPSPTNRFVRLCIRLLPLGTLWDVLWVNATVELLLNSWTPLSSYDFRCGTHRLPEATFPNAVVEGV